MFRCLDELDPPEHRSDELHELRPATRLGERRNCFVCVSGSVHRTRKSLTPASAHLDNPWK